MNYSYFFIYCSGHHLVASLRVNIGSGRGPVSDVIPPRAFVDSRRRRVVLLTGSQWAGSDDVMQSRGFVDKLPTQYMLRPTRRWAWHVT